MASLCRNALGVAARKHFYSNARCFATKVTMGDPLEHATGLEKKEIMAKMAGNDNPFDMKILKRGIGSKDKPNEIPSAFDSRMVGCICEEEATVINWMWLHKGQPRRCECGHWFKLVHRDVL